MPDYQVRFERFFLKLEGDVCWEWQGGKSKGYARFAPIPKNSVPAARISYTLYKGAIPPGEVVRHTCDNPGCVNPRHLITGTHQDNADDRRARGRSAFGERSCTAMLTPLLVRNIREELTKGVKGIELSKKYNVSPQTISDIKGGRTWWHSQ